MSAPEPLAAQLRALRLARGLTTTELGAVAHVSAVTIHRYEAGSRRPRPQVLRALAAALQVDLAPLLAAP